MNQRGNTLEIVNAFQNISDEQWLDILLKSINSTKVNNIELPGFPPEEVQRRIAGTIWDGTIREAYKVYQEVKFFSAKLGVSLTPDTRVLDFGCGWGRIIRCFLKDVSPENLYGVDVDPEMVDICLKTSRYGSFSAVAPQPPTDFADNSMDIIYAYSVFSHLAEPVHIKWIEEFSRILKPGGIFFTTTQSRHFIDFCQSLQGKTPESPWHAALAQAFSDVSAAIADYDSGKYVYRPTGGGPALPNSFYGEAVIPRSYIEREWTRYLMFQDFVDDRTRLNQAIVIMQKSSNSSVKGIKKEISIVKENVEPSTLDTKNEECHSSNRVNDASWFERLQWSEDRVLIDDWVFRLQHLKNDQWELSENCFIFFKTKHLIDQYQEYWSYKESFVARNVLELGMWDGGSIVFWNEYLKPNKIVGIDIQHREDSTYLSSYKRSKGVEHVVKTCWGIDQADTKSLMSIIDQEFKGLLDLVIDDASHLYEQSKKSFEMLFPYLRPGGLYFIEDWAWAHWKGQPLSAQMNANTTPIRLIEELIAATGSTRQLIECITVFEGFVVVERGDISKEELNDFTIGSYIYRHPGVHQPGENKLEAVIAAKDAQIEQISALLKAREEQVSKLEIYGAGLDALLKAREEQVSQLETHVHEKEATLIDIYKSRGYRLLSVYYRMKGKIF